MKTDIAISNEAKRQPITEVAKKIGLTDEYLELYGKYKAKVDDTNIPKSDKKAKLVLVTAVNPTPAGEGKTTTTIGLGQAFHKIGKNAIIALREPSLGPCMGIKGGATGGGYSQVIPMDDINLHFTGDFHAITTAHNLLSAMLDNHLSAGNLLGIDPEQIVWKRVLDLNDRSLRNIVIGLGGKQNGVTREDGFMITVASEVMAILCLSKDIMDLKERLGNIIVGYTFSGDAVTAKELNANNAMAALLKDAIKPNIVQTLEHTPVFIHGGPFANIAHGCNSIRATNLAMSLSDIVVTEAGFGADLGAEKFFDIKCRIAGLAPDAVVLVATVRALKYNGGVQKADLANENIDALEKGICNLIKHIENIQKYNVPVVVTLNQFMTDTDNEIALIEKECKRLGAAFSLSQVWEKGGDGGVDLAEKVLNAIENKNGSFTLLYPNEMPIKEKIETVAREIYGADGVTFAPKALKELDKINALGFSHFPVCMAKNQYSFSDDPKKLGRPTGFKVTVSRLTVSAGAGFVVAYLGDIMTMPGLSKKPAAEGIDVDETGAISGLF